METTNAKGYQLNFSRLLGQAMYDAAQRNSKAQKILAVISDHTQALQGELKVLDVGCSTGIMTSFVAQHFKLTVGMDIDAEAVAFANRRNRLANAFFISSDALNIPAKDESADVVICAHVYEHVPDAKKMMHEINRVLKPGGICFFSAGNRLSLMEPHYRLPFLSILPKPIAHWYLQSLGRGEHYYEKHLTYWGLKRLVSMFEIIDYTTAIIDDPIRFAATDVCTPGSRLQRLAALFARKAHWLIPTYVFVLKKDPVCQ
jgi:2-polyprenyl-3-methyl-5-hydroxy-6-metoxy-1,4-benzoquinol methylase